MQNEESSKNIKAGTMTGILCGLLLMLFFMVSWKSTIPENPIVDEGIEVNLGNSDDGMGDEQPWAPGDPALDVAKIQPPTPVATTQTTTETEKETNDNDKEAPNVTLPEVKKNNNKPKDSKPEPTNPVVKPNPKPDVVADPKPIVRKPVAIYKGGSSTSTGGNQSDDFNNKNNQGITGKNGDQGKINGSPTSDNYSGDGGTGKSGVAVSKGLQGRKISKVPSFEDDFNENAKIAVDVKVNENGVVTSANFQPKGSTTSNAGLREIAIRKALLIKFTASESGETSIGTLVFNFKVQ
jgi:hypothetical protein